MSTSIIDVDAIEKQLRDEIEKSVQKKVAAVRTLAKAAERTTRLRSELAEAEGQQTALYRNALVAGIPERDLAKLKPKPGVRTRTQRKTKSPTTEGQYSPVIEPN